MGVNINDAVEAPTTTEAIPTDPLRAPVVLADPYPVGALGDVLGSAAKALQETTKAPLALCAQSVLASAALAAQAHFDVKLPWGTVKPLSLFFLSVALSGERKTAIDDLVLGSAKTQERENLNYYDKAYKTYLDEMVTWKSENDKRLKKSAPTTQAGSDYQALAEHEALPEPEAPILPLRFTEDPTAEGLFKLLAISQPSVGLFSDEGGSVIGGHALSKDNALKTMSMWCKLWDGSNLTRVRAGDGVAALYGRRMSMHIQAQPEIMDKLLSDPMANGQGFLARCLVAYPESTIGSRMITGFDTTEYARELKQLYAKMKGLLEAKPRKAGGTRQELNPIGLPLVDKDAVSMAMNAVNKFEMLMKSGNDLCEITDRASKAVENACRIAGVLAVIEGGMATREISAINLGNGLVLMQWYLKEASRIRGTALIPPEIKHAEMLIKWLEERDIRLFNTSMILTRGSNQLRCKARLDPAIKVLMDSGHLIKNEPNTIVDGKVSRSSWRVLSYVV
jgi:putative DNA primase/helicase